MPIINGQFTFNDTLGATTPLAFPSLTETFNFICNGIECNSFNVQYDNVGNNYQFYFYNTITLETGFYGMYDYATQSWTASVPVIIFKELTVVSNDILNFLRIETNRNALNITLYKMDCEKNRLDKKTYLTIVALLNGTLKDSTSITKPSIDFKLNDFIEFNYMYINKFNRFYFVDDIISVKNKLWNVRASVDVLYSFMDEILDNGALIERCEDNSYINVMLDNDAITEKEVDTSFIALPNDSPIDSSTLEGTNHYCFVVQVLADA